MSGLVRTPLDPRDYSFSRSFGITATPIPPKEYNFDKGFGMSDQNADGYPFGCVGYTQASIASNQDGQLFDPIFTYQKTCEIEGHGMDRGCDIRTAAKVGQVYGMRPVYGFDEDSLKYRRGAFFNVDKSPGCDWFDSMRIAMRRTASPLSVGTIFFPEWSNPGPTGILTEHFVWDGVWDTEMGHNYEICGEKLIDGKPYLIAKTWQGPNFGDNGWCYIGREAFNKAFDIWGTVAIVQTRYTPKDVVTIKISILQFVLLKLSKILNIKLYA
jgi:hypothetical protein